MYEAARSSERSAKLQITFYNRMVEKQIMYNGAKGTIVARFGLQDEGFVRSESSPEISLGFA